MNSTPQERLNYFIDKVFKKKKNFSEYLGVHQSWISHYTGKGTSVIQSKQILDKLSKKGLNIDWYHTGIGDMLLDVIEEPIALQSEKFANPESRLIYFIELCYASKSAFAKAAGIHRNDVSRYTSGTIISNPDTAKKVTSAGLNYNWYLSGEGVMFADNEVGYELAKLTGKNYFTVEELSGGDIDKIIQANKEGKFKISKHSHEMSNVADIFDEGRAPMINISKMTPEQALRLVEEIRKKLPQLEKLAELAVENE